MKRFWLSSNPERIWAKVKKDIEKAPNPDFLNSVQFANLSKEGYSKLKKIAKANGITVYVSWATPDYQVYVFKNN